MDMTSLIKSPIARVFRRAAIKRRITATGQFETDWLDISELVKSYGKYTVQIDSARRNKFTFGTGKLVVENEEGQFNPHDSPSSLWFGYLNQQRTLVKIEAGYLYPQKGDSGLWMRNEFPGTTLWDEAFWDADASTFDTEESSAIFTGILSGDLPLSDRNEVTLNLKPLNSVFQDFPARNLTGWTSTGVTASQFVQMVRDQTDGTGNYIFRPFFGDTTSYWEISTTSTVFSNLNTSTSVIDKTVWEVIEKLAEVENFVPYVTRDGVFKFISRDAVATAPSYEFHGAGAVDLLYGHNMKILSAYGFKLSKFYSRVQIKWREENTSTAYAVVESTMTVSGTNNPWILGVRTLNIDNVYIPTSTVAQNLAQTIFNDVSSSKKEIEFTTSFIPNLDVFDRFAIYYDPTNFQIENMWDQNNWGADGSSDENDLIFDNSVGDAISLQGEEFKFLTFEIDLDNFENKFIAKEV